MRSIYPIAVCAVFNSMLHVLGFYQKQNVEGFNIILGVSINFTKYVQ